MNKSKPQIDSSNLSEIVREGIRHWQEVAKLHEIEGIFSWMTTIRRDHARIRDEELVDVAFLLRTFQDRFNDMRKETKKLHEFLVLLLAHRTLKEGINEDEDIDPDIGRIRGQLATASLEQGYAVNLPPKESAEFAQFMTWLGITDPEKMNVCSLNWRRVSELVTERTRKGKALPPGLQKMPRTPRPEMHLKKRPNLDLGQIEI